MASESQGSRLKLRNEGNTQNKCTHSGERLASSGTPDYATSPSTESLQAKVNDLKHYLEGWREVVIHFYNVLIWKWIFYPFILWAIVSIFFGIVHYSRLSGLTTIALFGMFVVIADYLVPILQTYCFDPNLWTASKERTFEAAVEGIICIQEYIIDGKNRLFDLKRTRPSVYFLTVLFGLLAIAWVGTLMDNTFLTYIIICMTLMLPGFVHRGYLRRFITCRTTRSPTPTPKQKH